MKVFLPDGRALRYWSTATAGQIVLFFHGCPDSRRIAMTGSAAAEEVGVRLLTFNRPGYGTSTPTDSTFTSVAQDAQELLDLWDIERVAVLGMSVGAPYAAAFAATCPERTTAVGLVAAPAMPASRADEPIEQTISRISPEFMQWRARIVEDTDDEAMAERFLAELPEADAALLRARGAAYVAAVVDEALADPEGYLRDAALLWRDWGFDVSGVKAPATLWVGEQDRDAIDAAPWWLERLPDVTLEVADTTHLATLLTQWPAILRRLADARG